jgi:hypothetical protein
LLDEIWRLAALVRSEMFTGVSKADRDVFARVLEKASGNLCALERESAPAVAATGKLPGRGQRVASS